MKERLLFHSKGLLSRGSLPSVEMMPLFRFLPAQREPETARELKLDTARYSSETLDLFTGSHVPWHGNLFTPGDPT